MNAPLLAESAATWLDHEKQTPRIDPALIPRTGERWLDGYRRRTTLRQLRAEEIFESSRDPERGLPVASNSAVGGFLKDLLSRRPGLVAALIVVAALSSVAGLIVPRILGDLIDRVQTNDPTLAEKLASICWLAFGVVVVQALLTFAARWVTAVFGMDVLSAAREQIVRTVLQLPLSRVETAGTGDLVTRVTRDVGTMANAVQWALPQFVIAGAMTVLTLAALVLNSPLLTIPTVLGIILLAFAVKSYLSASLPAYIAESRTYSVINSTLTESVEGARTAEALQLQRSRSALTDADVEESAQAERYTMTLRNLMFLRMDYAFSGPLVLVVVLGCVGYMNDWVSMGQIVAATLYVQQLVEPMDRLVQVLDRAQVGMASTTRLLGIAAVPQDRTATDATPTSSHLVARDVRFAYREGHDVLHGITLDLQPGERLAIVGPSGSGKSTLGRLLAGINGPRDGSVTVGDANLMELRLDKLRTEVALVTQEHHVFVGTLRDNIVLAREDTATEDQVWAALDAVDAGDWARRLPLKLETKIGSGNQKLTPAQAQQVALARLVIADPHTLVLDEATSLIDPKTARHLEGSMSSLLTGRTVVAIAHRLHTAHDADRIAVVIDGEIAELGSHEELIAHDGEYAALWRAWTS